MARAPHLLVALLTAAALPACGGSFRDPGQAPLRRLTPTEYNQTIRDLYGFETVDDWPEPDEDGDEDTIVWPVPLPPDIPVHGFEGMLEGQVSSAYLVERNQAAALHFGALASQAPHFWSCDRERADSANAQADCARESIEKLHARAIRREPTEEENARVRALFDAALAENTLEQAITLTVAGILSSPQFLFHLERATPRGDGRETLGHWTMASRLSYFLWDSMPDPALFTAAAQQKLQSQSELERQARRMLRQPQARQAVVHFHSQWLQLDRLHSTRADLDTYVARYAPETLSGDTEGIQEQEEIWSGALLGMRAGMIKETELFVEHTLFDGAGTLSALLTDNHGYVTEVESYLGTQTTAAATLPTTIHDSHAYTFELEDGNLGFNLTLRPATFPADQRAGLLTQGAVLASFAHPVHPAPVLRGKFVLEQLTCQELGQPPDGAEGAAPPDTLDADSTNRVRTEAITSAPVCHECHQHINPAGFAFENYDAMGGWRDQDNGAPVDASGELKLPGEGTLRFGGPVELARQLAQSRTVHDCYALQWTRYALGREPTAEELPELQSIQERFFTSGGSIEELLLGIVTSDLFRSRTPTEAH